jgi:hypothetical protein
LGRHRERGYTFAHGTCRSLVRAPTWATPE